MLEDGTNQVTRAVDALVGCDLVPVGAALAAAVLSRESFDADGTAVGDLAQETRGADRPEVLLFGWEFAVDTSLYELCPVGFVEPFLEIVGDRLDEVVRRNVVHRSHWRLVPFRGI